MDIMVTFCVHQTVTTGYRDAMYTSTETLCTQHNRIGYGLWA